MQTQTTTDARNIFFVLGISFYQTLIVFLLVICFFILVFYLWKKWKNFSKVMFLSLFFALIIGLIILLMVTFWEGNSYSVSDNSGNLISWTWQEETWNLLNVLANIYLGLVFVSIPIFVFFIVNSLIIKFFNQNISKKYFFKTFFSLVIPIIIGMFVALALIPLIKQLDLNENTPTSNSDVFTIVLLISNTFINTGFRVIEFIPMIVLIIVSIVSGLAISLYIKSNPNSYHSIDKTLTTIKDIVLNYLKLVAYLLPFVIITKLSSIFIYPEQITNLISFFVIFIIGFLIIILILNVINVSILRSFKLYFQKYFSYILIAFTKSNTINYLPETINISKEFGVSDNNAEFTSILGLNIGPAICSGYYLMLIALVGLDQVQDGLQIVNIVFMFILILAINFSTSGVKGGDEIARNVVISTLSTSFGVPPLFYYGSIFAMESILEPIRHTGNATSYITSNIINEKWNKNNQKSNVENLEL